MTAAPASLKILKVAVDAPMRALLDYLPPAGREAGELPVGARVRVGLGRANAIGIITAHAAQSTLAPERLRPIRELLDSAPLLAPELLELLQWTAAYYHHPPGEVIAAALPAALRAGQPLRAAHTYVALSAPGREAVSQDALRRAPRQRELLARLAARTEEWSAAELDALDATWRPAARALQERGLLNFTQHESAAPDLPPATPAVPQREATPTLSAAQIFAVETVDAAASAYGAFLLQGVTGSGKSEVYLQCAARTLARGGARWCWCPRSRSRRSWSSDSGARLRVPIAVLHSGLSDGERLAAWRSAHAGRARIVLGTRSAVFAPIRELGLIVVDEEHDSSYKQHESGCRYSARDLASRAPSRRQSRWCSDRPRPRSRPCTTRDSAATARCRCRGATDQAEAPRLALIDMRAHAVHAGTGGPRDRGACAGTCRRRPGAGVHQPPRLRADAAVHGLRLDRALRAVRRAPDRAPPALQLRCHHCGAVEPLPERCRRCGFAVNPSARAPSGSRRHSRACSRGARWCGSIAIRAAMRPKSGR